MKIINVGTMQVTDSIIACDPCRRSTHEWYNIIVRNMLPGTYHVKAILFDDAETNGWGTRVAEFAIVHENFDSKDFFPGGGLISSDDNCVGVDSGMVCFANLDVYEGRIADESIHAEMQDTLYADAQFHNSMSAIHNNIAACFSGYGDGSYDVWAECDEEGKVMALSMEFIKNE